MVTNTINKPHSSYISEPNQQPRPQQTETTGNQTPRLDTPQAMASHPGSLTLSNIEEDNWKKFGGVRIGLDWKNNWHVFAQIQKPTNKLTNNTFPNPAAYELHASSYKSPVWITKIKERSKKNIQWVYVPKHISHRFISLVTIWSTYMPQGMGCKFSYLKAIQSITKRPLLTQEGKHNIAAMLFKTMLARRMNNKAEKKHIITGLHNRDGSQKLIFCSHLIIETLQAAWLYDKIFSHTTLYHQFNKSITELSEHCQSDTKTINQKIWEHVEQFCKLTTLFSDLPIGLQLDANSEEPSSVMNNIRNNGLYKNTNTFTFKEKLINTLNIIIQRLTFLLIGGLLTFFR